ncbi:MAG: hypothetical protein JXB49_15255 [Bacteroidales bacterium]|nr:hypothetical protein [Bacteroidales bacterium]
MKKFIIFFLGLFLVECGPTTTVGDFYPLFPFVISFDGPDNTSSMAHLIETPAGKHGFVRVEKGRFVNDAGSVRLNGTNLTGPANFPSHEAADKLAARLVRLGINCVRHHFMDTWYVNFMPKPTQAILADDTDTQRELDPNQLDKLDYLIATLKKRGIYSDLNLHVGRTLDKRDGFINIEDLPWANKGINQFEPRMIELQKEYARRLLTHVNPYTGNAYTDEPSVALIEITNENSFMEQYFNGIFDMMKNPYAAELQRQWNVWLHRKYESGSALKIAWEPQQENIDSSSQSKNYIPGNIVMGFASNTIPILKMGNVFPKTALNDFLQFLEDTESYYWTEMYNYIKQDLKAKPPVSGTQLDYSPPHIQALLDYIDIHKYWSHPQGGWISPTANEPWTIENDPMVNTMGDIKNCLAIKRVNNKPYTISEYNHPYPNQFGAEGHPILCIYGRLQGWDGVFQYSYNHYVNDFEPQANPWCFFDCIARTDVLAHFPACAAIFLRGDVQESKESIIAAVDIEKYREWLADHRTVSFDIGSLGFDTRLSLVHKTALDFKGKGIKPDDAPRLPADQKVFISDTEEITWNTEKPDASYLVVNTANTKLFTGFPEGRTIEMGNVHLNIGKTRLNWATVSLVSRKATGFGDQGKPTNILLAATGDSGNSGRIIKALGGYKITLTDSGSAPVLVEGIPARIIIPSNNKKTKFFALDSNGDRKKEIPVKMAKGGGSKIILKPEYETIWYEIEIQ